MSGLGNYMSFMKKILIIASILICTLFVGSSIARTQGNNSAHPVFTVLMDLPRFIAQDKEEPVEERADRLGILAPSIVKASKKYRPRGTSERMMTAALMTIAYKETRLAKNVGIGRCDLMPKGQQCDSGKAKTYFQLWEVACPAVHDENLTPGSQEEMDIAAECAARLLTSAYNRCHGKHEYGNWAGAFAGYRSIDCSYDPVGRVHQGPRGRQDYMLGLHYKLSQAERHAKLSAESKEKSN